MYVRQQKLMDTKHFIRVFRASKLVKKYKRGGLFNTWRTGPGSSIGRVSAPGTGGHGFDPRPRHTEVVKNRTSCSLLVTQTYMVELGLVDPKAWIPEYSLTNLNLQKYFRYIEAGAKPTHPITAQYPSNPLYQNYSRNI